MKFSSICKRILIPLFLPYSLFIGCSVIGAVVGGASRPGVDGRVTSSLGLDSLLIGTDVQLVGYDRVTYEGEYQGLVIYPAKLYADRYASTASQAAYRGFIPGLNQKVTVQEHIGSFGGYFKGIDRGGILFQPLAGSDTVLVSPEDVVGIQASDSLRIDGKSVRSLIRDGTMLGRRVISLRANNTGQMIPYESIEVVLVKGHSSGAWTGFLIGAALDATAILVYLKTESDLNNAAEGCGGSGQRCSR